MEEATKYEIVLSDGTVLEDLWKNGDYYLSKTPFDKEYIEDHLSPVTIKKIFSRYSDDEPAIQETHEHMKVDNFAEFECVEDENGVPWPTFMGQTNTVPYYAMALSIISNQEMFDAKLRADIDFLAMAADIQM